MINANNVMCVNVGEISFRKADVPEFLRSSDFYIALEDTNESITLSNTHCKFNLYVKSLTDVHCLLSTMRFWGVKGISRELVMFVANNPEADLQPILAQFAQELTSVTFLEPLGQRLRDIEPNIDDSCIVVLERDTTSLPDRLVNILTQQFWFQRGQIWNERTCECAAELGWTDCLRFLHENGCSWDKSTCDAAAKYNNIYCLMYARTHGCPWDEATAAAALEHRSSTCFQYARDHGCPLNETVCAAAASNLACLKSLHESGCPWDEQTCANAAFHSPTACLVYAHEEGCPWDAQTCHNAALLRSIATLRYAHENGCPWNESVCSAAVLAEALHVLQYAHENGCPWNEETCIAAVRWNRIDCLQYAHLHGCPWNERVVHNAASTGSLACLKYALGNGCPGRDNACLHATRYVECLKYLREEENCRWDINVSNACASTNSITIDCLEYCIVHGCPVDETTVVAAIASYYTAKLELLHQHGCPWDRSALVAAASQRSARCFQYLMENNCPGHEDIVLDVAHYLPLLRIAIAHGCVLHLQAYECTLRGNRPLQCVKLLFKNGCPWPRDICCVFAQAKRADCLQFAHENGAEWDTTTSVAAVRIETSEGTEGSMDRALECLRYLHENGCPWDYRTRVAARETLNKACLEYVVLHGCPQRKQCSHQGAPVYHTT